MKLMQLAVWAALALATSSAMAADVIRLIIPTAPGGGTDGFFRIAAKEAQPYLDARLVIFNIPGAGGTKGVSELVNAKADVPTIAGVWNSPITVSPQTMKVPYTMDDYIPVMQLTSAPYVMCVHPQFPAHDGASFIEELKHSPDKYTYGNDGAGGSGQLATERVFRKLGARARPVPYKGAGDILLGFLSGSVDIYVGSIMPILPYTKNGKAKCLLLTSAKRTPMLPSASGLQDLGIPGEETLLWRALIAPKSMPAQRLAKIAAAFEKAANGPVIRKFEADAGEEVLIRKGADLRKMIRGEYKAFGEVAKSLNLKPQ